MPPASFRKLEWVFHPCERGCGSPSTAFADAAKAVLSASAKEVRIVGPYLSGKVVCPLLDGRQFRLITDLDACFEAGIEREVSRFLERNLVSCRQLPGVHAKVLFNDAAAFFGSANFTVHGFAGRDELGFLIREAAHLRELTDWFEGLWADAKELSDDAFRQFFSQASARESVRRLPRQHDVRRQGRSLGWLMEGPANQSPPRTQSRPLSQSEMNDLAATLRLATRSKGEAERTLELLAEALDISALDVDDPRLHLRFDPQARALHVTINQRYVAWAFAKVRSGRRSGFGMILDDAEIARSAVTTNADARVGWYRRPDTPAIDVPFEHLDTVLPFVRDSWHRAIRTEVERMTRGGKRRTSSFLKHKRPALYAILKDSRLRRQTAELAFRSP